MRSYKFNVDRIINQLVPHYMGGRKLVLYLQSCMSPLYSLADRWVKWANLKRMEAGMTTQVILFEYYLNHRFGKYLLDPLSRITINEGTSDGTALHWKESVAIHDNAVLFYKSENQHAIKFEYKGELITKGSFDFTIVCPAIQQGKIHTEDLRSMIAYQINRYKLANKKYNIIIQ